MNVMTVIAHPNPKSFCHAILRQFDAGLKEAGHTNDIVDLYAIRFDPVFRTRDFASYIHESMPLDMLEQMDLMKSIMDFCGGPVQRFVAKRWLKGKSPLELVKIIRNQMPKDVVAQQKRLARAQGLAFIAPNYWMNFPADPQGMVRTRLRPRFRVQPDAGGVARGVRRPDPPPPSREGPDHQHDPLQRRDLSGRIRKSDGQHHR